jgi:hypothetical protein
MPYLQALRSLRRLRAIGTKTSTPPPSNAHVEGSGTGVKLSSRLLPTSETENPPPPVLFEKPDVIILKSAELKPVMAVGDVANVQE